jgi:hypothetical protein
MKKSMAIAGCVSSDNGVANGGESVSISESGRRERNIESWRYNEESKWRIENRASRTATAATKETIVASNIEENNLNENL